LIFIKKDSMKAMKLSQSFLSMEISYFFLQNEKVFLDEMS